MKGLFMNELVFKIKKENVPVSLERQNESKYQVSINKTPREVFFHSFGGGLIFIRDGAKNGLFEYVKTGNEMYVQNFQTAFQIMPNSEDSIGCPACNQQFVNASMPGTVIDCFVEEGDKVKSGDRLIVIESMKMENYICAIIDGLVTRVGVKKGQRVSRQDFLIEISREVPND
ncbi:acetyl-CoA carboxylase biotin carboxyl carrier protein subunit [bacterium]|nr:acetyl-CoA carboxylase biotin carboxyl carrier protein subunit [bacterium]